MTIRAHPADQVIAAYIKVLGELGYMKAKRAPEHVLPLPKDEMATILRASEHPKKEELLEASTTSPKHRGNSWRSSNTAPRY